jgi:NADPH-dependent 2,4-dienoyl-CoA reductase/sulfur reductase-like enzyme
MRFLEITGLGVAALALLSGVRAIQYDLVIYGGTSAGVMAAGQATRMGKTVLIVGPDRHLGGLRRAVSASRIPATRR